MTAAATAPHAPMRNRRREPSATSRPRSAGRGQAVLGELDGLREPYVLPAEHVLDQALEHAHARWAPHHLRMEHQVEEAALLVLPLELLHPDLPDVLLAPDPVARGRIRAEAEVHE